MKKCLNLLIFVLLSCTYSKGQSLMPPEKHERIKAISGALGTYAAPPRLENGRVDHKRLLSELKDIKANTYHWLIWTNEKDFDDLKLFLPQAHKAKIKVWVTLVPPSESQPKMKFNSEPYKLDFEKWAIALATLSLSQPNLVAWSIDDFAHNLDFFTPAYVGKFVTMARQINPKLAFVPCIYYKQSSSALAKNYGEFFDGILFPYRAESLKADLQNSALVAKEIETLKSFYGQEIPIFLDIYATKHSRLGDSTPGYVAEVLAASMKSADGVFIYCHQDPKIYPEKYAVIKKGFRKK